MEVKCTTDYSQFKFVKCNRGVRALNKLVKSISDCNLLPYNPIKVTPKMEIIDGQHRFEACKLLNLPVYYTIIDDDIAVEKAIKTLNTAQRNWGLPDYLHFHCENGQPNMLSFRNFIRYHGIKDVNIGFAAMCYIGGEKDSNVTSYYKRIKAGTMPLEKWKNADEVCELLKALPIKHNTQKAFVGAFVSEYDNWTKKERDKILKNILLIQCYANVGAYRVCFQQILDMKK